MATQLADVAAGPDLTIEVSDPTGHQQVMLEGVRASATTSDIVAMAGSALKLPPNVMWDLREESSSRLLPHNQQIGEVAGEEAPHVKVALQPDAGLA